MRKVLDANKWIWSYQIGVDGSRSFSPQFAINLEKRFRPMESANERLNGKEVRFDWEVKMKMTVEETGEEREVRRSQSEVRKAYK